MNGRVFANPASCSIKFYTKKYDFRLVDTPSDEAQFFIILSPYFDWLENKIKNNQPLYLMVVWQVLHDSQPLIRKMFLKWLEALEAKALVEPDFGSNMMHALALEKVQDELDFLQNTTEEAFFKWIELLDSPNAVLRSIAAKCIGGTYTDWQDKDNEFQGHKVIPITQMLDMLYQKQISGKRVVAGFVDGCCVDGTLKELEQHEILVSQQFDIKAWVLKTAIDSPEEGACILGLPFLFYIHEYLDYDSESVNKLISGKRYWLALMCATESIHSGAYKVMQPFLERLQKEAPAEIAKEATRQVKIYLEQKRE